MIKLTRWMMIGFLLGGAVLHGAEDARAVGSRLHLRPELFLVRPSDVVWAESNRCRKVTLVCGNMLEQKGQCTVRDGEEHYENVFKAFQVDENLTGKAPYADESFFKSLGEGGVQSLWKMFSGKPLVQVTPAGHWAWLGYKDVETVVDVIRIPAGKVQWCQLDNCHSVALLAVEPIALPADHADAAISLDQSLASLYQQCFQLCTTNDDADGLVNADVIMVPLFGPRRLGCDPYYAAGIAVREALKFCNTCASEGVEVRFVVPEQSHFQAVLTLLEAYTETGDGMRVHKQAVITPASLNEALIKSTMRE
ncbi:hypothetical protein EBZ39_09025 [bacterium]|nr:hypothetical protein [bacterium]